MTKEIKEIMQREYESLVSYYELEEKRAESELNAKIDRKNHYCPHCSSPDTVSKFIGGGIVDIVVKTERPVFSGGFSEYQYSCNNHSPKMQLVGQEIKHCNHCGNEWHIVVPALRATEFAAVKSMFDDIIKLQYQLSSLDMRNSFDPNDPLEKYDTFEEMVECERKKFLDAAKEKYSAVRACHAETVLLFIDRYVKNSISNKAILNKLHKLKKETLIAWGCETFPEDPVEIVTDEPNVEIAGNKINDSTVTGTIVNDINFYPKLDQYISEIKKLNFRNKLDLIIKILKI